eukprot:4277447-Pyramimonas_sp.AAC.1
MSAEFSARASVPAWRVLRCAFYILHSWPGSEGVPLAVAERISCGPPDVFSVGTTGLSTRARARAESS